MATTTILIRPPKIHGHLAGLYQLSDYSQLFTKRRVIGLFCSSLDVHSNLKRKLFLQIKFFTTTSSHFKFTGIILRPTDFIS